MKHSCGWSCYFTQISGEKGGLAVEVGLKDPWTLKAWCPLCGSLIRLISFGFYLHSLGWKMEPQPENVK